MSLFGSGTLLVAMCLFHQAPRYDRVVSYRNITLYPIYAGLSNRAADIVTLDEGIKQGTVVITETGDSTPLVRQRPTGVSGFGGGGQVHTQLQSQRGGGFGAQVNTLWLTNNSGKTLLLVAGEMLLGGQQDRIVQKDGLIPPTKEPVDLAVFCVEHGRWTPQTSKFGGLSAGAGGMGGGGAFAAPGGGRRAAVMAKGQAEVWDSVGNQLRSLGTENSSGTYRENYVSEKTRPVLDEYVSAIMPRFPVGDAAGVVVAINGKLIWMDRFDSRRTFAKYWPKLLRSYALEAMAEPGRTYKTPSYSEAMHYAQSRDGKASFEGEEGLSKLTKVESGETVLYELEDLQMRPGILLHANKVTKR